MSAKIPLGWDVFNACNGYTLPSAGGRVFSLGGIPVLCQDAYDAYWGSPVGAQARGLLCSVVRWLRGTRTDGTIAVPSGDSNLSSFGDGENEPTVGSLAIAALAAAGYTVVPYSGLDLSTAIAGADVLVLDLSTEGYNTFDHNSNLIDAVRNQDKAILDLYTSGIGSEFGFSTGYRYNQSSNGSPNVKDYRPTFPWTGAEAIFDATFASGTLPNAIWGGRTQINVFGSEVDGETYPSNKLALWRNRHGYTFGFMAAWTQHADCGTGEAWTL